jgi:hypothetical protein
VDLENVGIAGTHGIKDGQSLILEIRDMDEYRLYAEDTRAVLKGASDD